MSFSTCLRRTGSDGGSACRGVAGEGRGAQQAAAARVRWWWGEQSRRQQQLCVSGHHRYLLRLHPHAFLFSLDWWARSLHTHSTHPQHVHQWHPGCVVVGCPPVLHHILVPLKPGNTQQVECCWAALHTPLDVVHVVHHKQGSKSLIFVATSLQQVQAQAQVQTGSAQGCGETLELRRAGTRMALTPHSLLTSQTHTRPCPPPHPHTLA